MVAWPTHRHRRQALDHAGGAQQRYRGQQSTPLPSGATTIPEGAKPASRGNACPDGSTTSASGRRCMFFPLSISSWHSEPSRPWRWSLRAVPAAVAAWRCGSTWSLRGALAPRVAWAPQSQRTLSRGSPHREGRVAEHAGPRGGQGGLARRWRVRWDGASGHAERARLGLRRPYGHEPDGDVGGRPLAPRCMRRVSPAGEADGVHRGLGPTRGVWSRPGTGWLGQGVARAPVSGEQAGDSRGGLSLVAKALPHRDFFLRPEKSRFPYS